MNWADLNPLKRAKKPAAAAVQVEPAGEESVYVRVILDKPLQGISRTEPTEKPWIRLSGIGLEAAAQAIPGKTINWHTVPMELRAKLELDPQCADMGWEDLKRWIRG